MAMRAQPSGPQSAVECWARVRLRLKSDIGDTQYNSWIRPLGLAAVHDGCVRLTVSTAFLRDFVLVRFRDRLLQAWRTEDPSIHDVEVIFAARTPDLAPAPDAGPDAGRPASGGAASGSVVTISPALGDLAELSGPGVPLDPRYTFDEFVVGKSNELAFAAAKRVAESEDVQFNPLFLYGGVGLGKTHLLQAIAHEVRRRRPARRVLYLSAEKFMTHFIRALRDKDTVSFKERLRSADVLLIDDVQFISGKGSTQEEFFHTFNALIDNHRQLVFSADRPPVELDGIEERIRSRLVWGMAADIHPTDYELRLGILQTKMDRAVRAGQVPKPIHPDILQFLARRITANIRELEGALTRLIANANLMGRPITMDVVQEVLADLIRAAERKVSIDDIQRRVCEYYNLRLSDLHSPRRARAVARPRQVAMYLCKQLTPRSLPEIGRKFGGRDHTTVLHAVRKIDELRAVDPVLDEDIDVLKRMLGNWPVQAGV